MSFRVNTSVLLELMNRGAASTRTHVSLEGREECKVGTCSSFFAKKQVGPSVRESEECKRTTRETKRKDNHGFLPRRFSSS